MQRSRGVLQGDKMQVMIDSRYFFGEPVANAKVKYEVYHSPHYWWDDEDDDSEPGDAALPRTPMKPQMTTVGYGADQESEQTGKLDANGKLTITVPTSVDSSQRQDGPGLYR